MKTTERHHLPPGAPPASGDRKATAHARSRRYGRFVLLAMPPIPRTPAMSDRDTRFRTES